MQEALLEVPMYDANIRVNKVDEARHLLWSSHAE